MFWPQPIAPSPSSQIGMCTPEVLTWASRHALMRSWQVVLQVPVSDSGATPIPPANEYDAPPLSFALIVLFDASAQRTMYVIVLRPAVVFIIVPVVRMPVLSGFISSALPARPLPARPLSM